MPPRILLPKDEQGFNEGSSSSTTPKTSKRKAVSSACIPCRKRKSKCDGGLPSCSTCLAVYRTDCNYDQDTDHRRKGALRKDIQSLQVKNSALDVIVNSLRVLPDAEASALFHSLRRGDRLDTLAESLGAESIDFNLRALDADLSEQIGTPGSSFHAQTPTLRSTENSRSPAERPWGDNQLQGSAADTSNSWFRVPQDAEFVEHLLNHYFSWVHPFYALFPKDAFLSDMARGSTKHCSAMLVNAILALACHYSDRAGVRSDPSKSETVGDYFYNEAKELEKESQEANLTTVQALAVMALREECVGNEHSGYRTIGKSARMALELGLHLSDSAASIPGLRPSDIETRKITFWGVFNVEMSCCMGLGRTSSLPLNTIDVELPSATDKLDTLMWQPYEDINLPVSPSALHPMKCLLFVQHYSKLSQIVNEVNLNLYAPKERFTPRKLTAAYNRYQSWYADLPEPFQLQNTAMPHVIALHMYYHMCVLHLFRPFMKLDLQAIGLYPQNVCNYCASEISSLMNALRGLYGLRRVCIPVPVALLAASTIYLLNLPSSNAAVQLSQALRDLQAMSLNHRYAGRCIEVIYQLANQWGITLPETSLYTGAFQSPEPPRHTYGVPSMTGFYTQTTLSNESIDSATTSTHGIRHDSGSIFEPSFMTHNYPLLSPHRGSDASTHHSIHGSSIESTPVQPAQGIWTSFPSQHQMQGSNMQSDGYQMMNDLSQYAFNPYQPQG